MKANRVFISVALFCITLAGYGQTPSASKLLDSTGPPHLTVINGVRRLVVKGRPFLLLGGELHNSSSSCASYMEPIWQRLVQMNLNTVLVPISWALIEPEENQFEFGLVDELIMKARQNNLKIVFLWFGSWKNLVSTYTPEWVKTNPKRFPLYISKSGAKYQMLSSFSKENSTSDSRAYAALMKHIKQVDSKDQTVIMMQVENEVGTESGEKDCSKVAVEIYEKEVPKELLSYLQKHKEGLIPEFQQVWAEYGNKKSGTWKELFGEGIAGNQIFMAWHLAKYIGAVIDAGKSEYDIPMFVNAAIGRQDEKLGTYPSGGPLPFVMDVWRAAAPKLDLLCPDIYYGDFIGHCQKYTQSGNPLLIPETRAGEIGAANAVTAFANFNAIGFSPFGIDGNMKEPINEEPVSQIYKLLRQLAPMILSSEANKQMIGVIVDSNQTGKSACLDDYTFSCNLRRERLASESPKLGYAVLIQIKPGEFIVAGKNIDVEFSLLEKTNHVTAILSAEEGDFQNGTWTPRRWLNGDEIMVSYSFSKLFEEGKSGNGLKFNKSLSVQRVRLYQY